MKSPRYKAFEGGIPALWELDKDQIPLDEQAFFDALLFLYSNNEWMEKNKEVAIRYCELLARTNITKTKHPKESRVILDTLINKHPLLFSMVKLDIEGSTATVSKMRMMQMSERFNKLLSKNNNNANHYKVEIQAAKKASKEVIDTFLNYLSSWELNVTMDSALDLFQIAKECQMKDLKDTLLEFIKENLDIEHISGFLIAADQNNIEDLKWQNLIFIFHHAKSDQLKSLLSSKELSEGSKNLILTGIGDYNFGIEPGLSESGQKIFILHNGNSFSADGIKLINTIKGQIQVDSFKVEPQAATDENLEKLANSFHEINYLNVSRSIITAIPQSLLDNLKELDCSVCPRIRKIKADKLLKLFCRDCDKLTQLNAPHLKVLDCGYINIVNLNISNDCVVVGSLPVGCRITHS